MTDNRIDTFIAAMTRVVDHGEKHHGAHRLLAQGGGAGTLFINKQSAGIDIVAIRKFKIIEIALKCAGNHIVVF